MIWLDELTVPELKRMCRDEMMLVGGTKPVLLGRLRAHRR
jgi:hypothetical protein